MRESLKFAVAVGAALALVIGLTAPTAAVAETISAAELVGLWRAKHRFGPDARGPLIIERVGDTYVANFAGFLLSVRAENGELVFELPGDRGAFRGRLDGRLIRGTWVRPGTPPNNGRYASSVTMRRESGGRWSGTVDPLQDEFTFFLSLAERSDGSLSALLRNPERDVGTQWGVRRLVRDGNALKLVGRRGDGPEREIATGRYDAETKTFTLAFPSRGGTYDFAREGDTSDFWPRGRSPGRYGYVPPPPRGDGWPTGTLTEAAIDRPAIERLVQSFLDRSMDSADAPQIHALLIARHGKLVLEEYFHGNSRDRLHDLRSASKSMTAVTIGAAMHEGAPLALSSPVYQVMNGGAFSEGVDAQKRTMTLEHLLTMSSGYFCDDTNDQAPGNEEVMNEQTAEPDWYRYTMRVPLATTPGRNSVYCSASPHLALGMLGASTGKSPLDAFDRLVAEPMKIARYAWPLDPAGHPYGGGGLQLTARDFMKFGQLMLGGGKWDGRRILGADFAAAATSPQYHLRNIFYGYLWWVEDYPYKDRIVRSYSARGNGGQQVTVVPELALVVTTMAGNYFSRVQLSYTAQIVPRSILPAVREAGDDPGAPVSDREYNSPYGKSADGSRVQRD